MLSRHLEHRDKEVDVIPLMIPDETVPSRPNGLPNAKTSSSTAAVQLRQRTQLFVVHIDRHASHHDRSQLSVQTQTPLESRFPFRLKLHWTRFALTAYICGS